MIRDVGHLKRRPKPQLLTNSRIECFNRCPFEHDLAYNKGLRREVTEEPLRIGTVFHDALHDMRMGAGPEFFAAGIRSRYHLVPDWADEHTWRAEGEKIAQMVLAYAWRWSTCTWELISSEQSGTMPILNAAGNAAKGWLYAGKWDVIWRLDDARIALTDTKTTSEDIDGSSDFWRAKRINNQLTRYADIARRKGIEIDTLIYDAVRKPSLERKRATPIEKRKYRKKDGALYADQREEPETLEVYGERIRVEMVENHEKYFRREEMPRTDRDYADSRADLWEQYQTIRTGRVFKNPSACINRGWRCQFLDFCHSFDSLNGETPEGFVKLDFPHPELGELS